MIDGNEDLRAPAPQIEAHILQHMLDETKDLFDEAPKYALEGARSVQAAMALTRADWLLMSVHNWIVGRMSLDTENALDVPLAVTGIDSDSLSTALNRFVSRVDRLHVRARTLDQLTGPAWQPEDAPQASAQVLYIFGDPIMGDVRTNAVLETRRRLNWAFSTP